MAHFTTLYSGSSGNCAVVEEDGRYLLVDMGKSCRTTAAALKSLGLSSRDLGGVLVTHEHSDHVGGLSVFLRHYPVPVYAGAATLDELAARALVPAETQLVAVDGRSEDVAGFGVQSFATSHDSVGCCGYRITTPKGKTVAIATDLGYVSDEVMANLFLADVVALEANYDFQKLMTGPYPYYLKTRIASKRGHLCNDESAAALAKLAQAGCTRFALCHISQENNTPELALQAVLCGLGAAGLVPGPEMVVRAAARHEVTPPFEF